MEIRNMDLNLEKIRNHAPRIMEFDQLRKSAVAVPLIETENGLEILFEERSLTIPDQPGDICFPGGKIEEGETPEEAAVREVCEELLISPEQIEILGACDIYMTGKGGAIYPFVVKISGYEQTFSRDEVKEVFTVPVSYFLENEAEEAFTTATDIPDEDFPFDRIYGGRSYRWGQCRRRIVFYQYGGKNIWGITGKITEWFINTFVR